MSQLELFVTLWPSFAHFPAFAKDARLSGIRLNSAMISPGELTHEFAISDSLGATQPFWFDVKGRQPRVVAVQPDRERLIITLNHPISVDNPQIVLFKGGEEGAWLERLEDGGRRLVFFPAKDQFGPGHHGPASIVRPGESLHIRHPSFTIHANPLFTLAEVEKIERVKARGQKRWFLSYVESMRDIDQFLEIVGSDAEVMLKIENERGLEFVAREFKKRDNLTLVAARGDLYVEVSRAHEVLSACKLIRERDPVAMVGSRLLLSLLKSPVPSCADFAELAWLYENAGYRRFLLCDEICLKGELLNAAVNAWYEFFNDYC